MWCLSFEQLQVPTISLFDLTRHRILTVLNNNLYFTYFSTHCFTSKSNSLADKCDFRAVQWLHLLPSTANDEGA